MKKSLIALAVAGVVSAPAFAATSNVDVYGVMRMSVDHSDVKATDRDAWSINDRVSRIGFKGSEDLGGGLKAVWQIEQQLSATDPVSPTSASTSTSTSTSTGGITTTTATTTTTTTTADSAFGGANLRNTFIGLSGGFGTVLVGRHDTPYKLGGSADLFADTAADSQRAGAAGIIGRNGFDTRANGTVAYVSPDFSGFHFAAAVIPGEEAGGTAATNDANGLMDAYSLMGAYANGPLKMTLAYERLSKDMLNTTDSKHATKFNIGYKIGDIGLGYTLERSKDGTAAGNNTDTGHLASVSYGMGPITLMGQYGQFNNKEANAVAAGVQNDMTRWTVGAAYALSKRTSAYAAYNIDDTKNTDVTATGQTGDVKTLTIGMNHSF